MNHILLALETSGTRCGVALLQGSAGQFRVLADHHDGTQAHAEWLLPMVTALLERAGQRASDLQAVAFGHGPGGFTGLRVACGVAQGIALSLDVPVIPVGSLDAVAHAVPRGPGPTLVAVAMDARMGEAYVALFVLMPASDDAAPYASAPILVQPPMLLAAADLQTWRDDAPLHAAPVLRTAGGKESACRMIMAGDAWTAHEALVRPSATWIRENVDRPDATAVAALGIQAFMRGEGIDAAQAQPLYVRDKVAFTTAERSGGLGGNPRAPAHVAPGALS